MFRSNFCILYKTLSIYILFKEYIIQIMNYGDLAMDNIFITALKSKNIHFGLRVRLYINHPSLACGLHTLFARCQEPFHDEEF